MENEIDPQVPVINVQVVNADDCLVKVDEGGNYGCIHYKRRCKIRAPCCDEVFDCRHCHNEAKNSIDIDPLHRHDVPRHEVKKVQQNCINCGICMGNYFCQKCKFFDDDVSKNQYHCEKCGICRTGGEDNFFHCDKCGCCYSRSIKDTHVCVERAMHHDCPICFEVFLPVCSKSICDLSDVWEKLDHEVWILCNDCENISRVQFHIVGHKCDKCKSYNTRQIRGHPSSSSYTSSVSEEVVH
ncbi:putative Zinc finger, CHY-type, Zinc finger, CTCHY-type, Zinc finger, CTCHY-type superfamily [Helianthus annuus]|nr:putative Zinc finger, CHY-type, Zinc finger, CTCHY-type, Zinc finger, CTCHY-type superfamily [Helianthus annuus]